MDLTKMYVGLWMSGESLTTALRYQGEPLSGTWVVWGQVHGETHGVGLWVTIEAVSNPEGKGAPLTSIEDLPMLIRWEYILGGTASNTPIEKRPIGFLPKLESQDL